MVWLHLGRTLGTVVLIAGLPAIMAVVPLRGPSQIQLLLALGACLIAALWLVARCDRVLRRRQVRGVGKMKALGQEFSEGRLVVGMRWSRWLLMVALLAGVGVLAVLFGTAHGRREPVLGTVVVTLVLALLAIPLWTHVLQAARAVRYGYMLCVDPRGFHVVGECFVPWSKLHDAAVQHRQLLQLVVEPSAAVGLQGRTGEWPWQWGRPVVAAQGRIIQVPLRLLAVGPNSLEEAVYALCKRYAGQEFWERNGFARLERDLETLQSDLKVLGSIDLDSLRKMPVAKQEGILQAGLDALEKTGAPERATGP